jgi:hypothetical protein
MIVNFIETVHLLVENSDNQANNKKKNKEKEAVHLANV